jgi:hypothetical protein
MTFVYIMLGVLYVVLLATLGIATLRKGHYALFFFGIFFPVLWIVGAMIGPTANASAAAAGPSPQ